MHDGLRPEQFQRGNLTSKRRRKAIRTIAELAAGGLGFLGLGYLAHRNKELEIEYDILKEQFWKNTAIPFMAMINSPVNVTVEQLKVLNGITNNVVKKYKSDYRAEVFYLIYSVLIDYQEKSKGLDIPSALYSISAVNSLSNIAQKGKLVEAESTIDQCCAFMQYIVQYIGKNSSLTEDEKDIAILDSLWPSYVKLAPLIIGKNITMDEARKNVNAPINEDRFQQSNFGGGIKDTLATDARIKAQRVFYGYIDLAYRNAALGIENEGLHW